jgi:hypothetical protein
MMTCADESVQDIKDALVDENDHFEAQSPRKPAGSVHNLARRFHDSPITQLDLQSDTKSGISGLADIDGIRKQKQSTKVLSGTKKTLSCPSGSAIIGFEKIERYAVKGQASACSFTHGMPASVLLVPLRSTKGQIQKIPSESQCANQVRDTVLRASGATWNSQTQECSANIQEPEGITSAPGLRTCQFYPRIKWSKGEPSGETIRVCTYDGNGGCSLESLQDWSNEACARYVRKEYPTATGAVVYDLPDGLTKECWGAFGNSKLQQWDKAGSLALTHFFVRSGGWSDCGTDGTPEIIHYLPRSIPPGADKSTLDKVVDIYDPLDQHYNGWPMWRGIRHGYIVYNVAGNPSEFGCESWMHWVIDTADSNMVSREQCRGVLAGYATDMKFQRDVAFMWKTYDKGQDKWLDIDAHLSSKPERSRATLLIECADVDADVSYFRAACGKSPALGWGAR